MAENISTKMLMKLVDFKLNQPISVEVFTNLRQKICENNTLRQKGFDRNSSPKEFLFSQQHFAKSVVVFY